MKKTALVVAIALLTSCNSVKNKDKLDKMNHKTISIDNTIVSCPEDGICTIEVLKNKTLLIKKDEINSIYYQTIDDKDHSIIKYTYTKNKEEGVQDNSYVEELLFEIDNSYNKLELNNSELESTKMLFGRHCYCKGQAGYFPINSGKLILKKNNEVYNIYINFRIEAIPQIVNTIEVSTK